MESDANKRQRGNSITATTNGHPNPPDNTDAGSVATSGAGNEHSAASSIERCMDEQTYVSGIHRDKVVGNPHPRSQQLFPRPHERSVRSNPGEKTLTLEPPVTKQTLSELDVSKIINNPKLRHDINFDPDLHFRPNLDGEKGRRKTQKGNEFWETMQSKLQEFLLNREQFEREHQGMDWCLPATLKAIRAILETLVPPQDCASIDETFNVELLMQQFRKGVADMPKLALWLSQLLKSHCAPMRDNWVDEMVQQLSDGDRNFDVALLVVGIKSLLAVLEAMKLDIANHQIRCLRPALIDNTAEFEQKFFTKKIKAGKVDITGAYAWYRRAISTLDPAPLEISRNSRGNPWDFMKALVNLTLPTKDMEAIPHTFLFDEERLLKLRSEMLDLINIEVCMFHYHSYRAISRNSESNQWQCHQDMELNSSSESSSLPQSNSADISSAFSSPIISTHTDFSCKRRCNRISGRFDRDHSGVQTFVPKVENEHSSSVESSPMSSPSSASSIPYISARTSVSPPQPAVDPTTAFRSMLTILVSAANSSSLSALQKWTNLAPDLALQILRFTSTPLSHLPQFEKTLAFHLSNCRSQIFLEVEKSVVSKLLPELHRLVESYTPKSTYQIFEAATGPSVRSRTSLPLGQKADICEIATRIAHLGVLHWQVWGEWFYQRDLDEFLEMIILQP
ncbi:hypothetical protein K3495_g7833 [Podosphaera aphanis]|nr:hypothetical protein K3495_g7833 [Podosphaera aphanis]